MLVSHFREKPRGPVTREKIPAVDNATVDVPAVSMRTETGMEYFKPCCICLLSDKGALLLGRITANTLPDGQFVIVTFVDGTATTIGRDTTTGELIFGRLGKRTVIRPVDLGEWL